MRAAGVEFTQLTEAKRNELREYLVKILGLSVASG